jgi:hypothetical protein
VSEYITVTFTGFAGNIFIIKFSVAAFTNAGKLLAVFNRFLAAGFNYD